MTPMALSIGSKLSVGETTRTENTTTPKPIFKILQKKWPLHQGSLHELKPAGWKIVRRPGFEVVYTIKIIIRDISSFDLPDLQVTVFHYGELCLHNKNERHLII